MSAIDREAARAGLLKVFRYLREFNRLRNPVIREIGQQPWVMWFEDLPDHPAISRPGRTGPGGEGAESGQDGSFVLRVCRPVLTAAPEPPEEIQPWLKQGWKSPDNAPEVVEERTETFPDGTVRAERFADSPIREALWREYRERHAQWARTEKPAREAMAIFDRLYALHSRLDRESERVELMLGDGLLRWQPPAGPRIDHPILLQRVTLTFDPDVPAFTIAEADQPPELYTGPLTDLTAVQPAVVHRCQEDLEQGGCSPLGGEETEAFLRRTVALLAPGGQFEPAADQAVPPDAPVIIRKPVLFLRNRSMGFDRLLEGILADLQTREEIPPALLRVLGMEPAPAGQGEAAEQAASPNGEDEEILLTKPANPEQVAIARRLERYGAVLVQGPPGTGKTHTIANLLGHLLAQGKSVLVTSQTARALRALRDQVVEPLQPLCVSLLDEGTAQLEAAVDAISDRLATANADELEAEARALEQQRLDLLKRLREAREALRNARMDEYRPIVFEGREFTPVQAARLVAARRESDGWIPRPVTPGVSLPLTEGEILELYRTNRSVHPDEESELGAALPNPAELLSPSEFAALLEERRQIAQRDLDYRTDLWQDPPPEQTADVLSDLLERVQSALAVIPSAEPWRLEAMLDARTGGSHEQGWRDLIAQIREVARLAYESEAVIMGAGPELPADRPDSELEAVAEAILQHLRGGGRLGGLTLLLRREWKQFIDSARVRGSRPATQEDFEAILAAIRLRRARTLLRERWQRQMTPLGGPAASDLGAEPERVAGQFIPEIEKALTWFRETWEPLQQELSRQGLLVERLLAEVPVQLSQHGELLRLYEAFGQRLAPVVEARIWRLRKEALDAQLAALTRTLETVRGAGEAGCSRTVADLLEAVREEDEARYQEAFTRLVTTWNKQGDLTLRRELLRKLEAAAPGWASAIRARQGVHGQDRPPGDPKAAWLWRQLEDELDRRGRVPLVEIQRQINQLTADLHRVTAALVEKRAWAQQIRRTTLTQRQALQGWKLLMRKAGKRTGRRAPQFLAEARRLMAECQSAVPVWIMPLSRVAESFHPARNRFDVVIIDEASESDMLALAALYLGRQVVVVGDHEQVSPLAVGLDMDRVHSLIETHLGGIPNRLLFDGQSSVYDLAQTVFEPVCLVEHFRCVAPIIQFSNHLSYKGRIRPLRDDSLVRRRPATVVYRVEGASVRGQVNEKEAVAVASLLMAAAEQPEYADATFGVISLLADAQARRIDELLQHHMSPAEYSRRRIRCGSAADFQGDERHVMFLSMVDVPSGRGPLPLRGEGAGQMFKKRYNVAASRARDQMWVVHSLDPGADLKPEDLRLRLIKHASDPAAAVPRTAAAGGGPESEFEKLVLARLTEAGYHVVPRWEVGAYQIDMVVLDGPQRVAVECDGDRWYTPESLQEDIVRQAILERMGWRFIRIRGSQFFRDPDGTMAQVMERLRELGVRPVGRDAAVEPLRPDGEELLQRIFRRAAEIRREWALEEQLLDTAAD